VFSSEPFGAIGPVDAAQIHEGGELAVRVVAQMGEHAQDRAARDGRAQFALFDLDGQNVGAEIGLDLVAERGERWIEIRSHFANRLSLQRMIVVVRLIFFCSWMIP
jgi:hypothetical protein